MVTFVMASPANALAHAIYARWASRLKRFESAKRLPDEAPIDPGDAKIAVIGMGCIYPEADTPALYLRDGGRFAIIVQHREAGLPRKHRLTGSSRAIYQFCQRPRSMGRLRAAFESVAEDELRSFLKMMVAKGLMFAESERYLSLAAPLSWRRLEQSGEGGGL